MALHQRERRRRRAIHHVGDRVSACSPWRRRRRRPSPLTGATLRPVVVAELLLSALNDDGAKIKDLVTRGVD